ncbi:MAG: DUF2807 domain-containing protein [Bacteroidales bacterium]|nr:DUF2807 domain-containing protein [Bacteroidales bacterium]
MKRSAIFVILLSFVLVFSCSKDKMEKCGDNGELGAQTLMLQDFNQLDIQSRFQFYFVQDTASYAVIEGPKDMLENVKFDLYDSLLTISDENTCKMFKGYPDLKIELHFKELSKVEINGNADCYSEDTLRLTKCLFESRADLLKWNIKVKAQELSFQFHAVIGEFTMSGEVENLYSYSSGSNHLYFENLVVQNASVNHSSLGNMHLTVQEKLNLTIAKSGDFYLHGSCKQEYVSYAPNASGHFFHLP